LFWPGEYSIAGNDAYVVSTLDLLTAEIGNKIFQSSKSRVELPNNMQNPQPV
jgi:hypothetical protein